jgi:hypothetical protein
VNVAGADEEPTYAESATWPLKEAIESVLQALLLQVQGLTPRDYERVKSGVIAQLSHRTALHVEMHSEGEEDRSRIEIETTIRAVGNMVDGMPIPFLNKEALRRERLRESFLR